jgi:hypothetical protein
MDIQDEISGTDEIIPEYQEINGRKYQYVDAEAKIFAEAEEKLSSDAFFGFSFKRVESKMYMSRYINGEFNEKFFLYVIKASLDFYDLVRKDELERMEEGKAKIATCEALFQLEMDDFVDSIKEMEADELRLRLIYAHDRLSELLDDIQKNTANQDFGPC